MNLGLSEDTKRMPEVIWLLNIISTLDPKNPIFARDYIPENVKEMQLKLAVNDDGFFSGLPEHP